MEEHQTSSLVAEITRDPGTWALRMLIVLEVDEKPSKSDGFSEGELRRRRNSLWTVWRFNGHAWEDYLSLEE